MTFTSLIFMAFVALAAVITTPLRGGARALAMLVASAIFIASYVPDVQAFVPVIVFVLLGYVAIIVVERHPAHATAICLTLLVVVFIWLKRYPFVTWLGHLPWQYTTIGMSYILFRILHLVIEIGDGVLSRPRFDRYLAYLLFFPSFLSGPINRYEPFARDLDAPRSLDNDWAYATLRRLLWGFVKVSVVGEVLHLMHATVSTRLDGAIAAGVPSITIAVYFALAAPLYLLFLYANFSGYTDMAIAIGRLFGITLPENFNRPLQAANFQDFWTRWHMSLSEWFKIYVFNPLMRALMGRFPSRAAEPYLVVFALFIIFLVLGAWHGASWEFLLCGVLFATGVSANKFYQIEMTRRLGKKGYRALTSRPLYIWNARGFTLAYFAIAQMTFWRSVGQMGVLALHLGVVGGVVTTVLMTAGFALALWFVGRIESWFTTPRANFAICSTASRAVGLGGLVLLLAVAVPMINSSSDFVYKAF